MRCAWSSSGGKDSLLALWRARESGHTVTTIVTMFDETGTRSRSHGISVSLMRAQAAALGMELVIASASWQSYEQVFVSVLRQLRATGIEGVVFGDIDLQAHREWEEKVCVMADLQPILPLWQGNRRELAAEVLQLGFKCVVACVDHRYLSADFCGREYNDEFLRSLPAGVDPCGENGEFHTFVYDGPPFMSPLQIRVAAIDPYQAPAEWGGGRFSFARLQNVADTSASAQVNPAQSRLR